MTLFLRLKLVRSVSASKANCCSSPQIFRAHFACMLVQRLSLQHAAVFIAYWNPHLLSVPTRSWRSLCCEWVVHLKGLYLLRLA